MILENGKFYEEGVEVPLKIGDKEQIRLLKDAGHYDEPDYDEEGREITSIQCFIIVDEIVEYKYKLDFNCVCGKSVSISDGGFDDECEIDLDLDGRLESCVCGKVYEIELDNKKGYTAKLWSED